jgi:hypothetical protein
MEHKHLEEILLRVVVVVRVALVLILYMELRVLLLVE